ncbi:peptidoglycan-binding protein [Alkalicoccus halolimnae]|uniref:Peptidoglycan-binding protein n=1 Tax=Alkalicoccus halolimnae TaxID=1667239 RepID=A0AAJ8LYF4_9BACI
MKKYSFKSLGISAAVAGSILFAGGNAASADEGTEFGEDLLFEGKSHSHVAELNELLADQDYLDEDTGSTYTSSTTEAVRSFQEDNDLLVDGLAGVQTAGAVSELSKGDTGFLVEELQEKLAFLGLYDYKVDGIYGPITEEAVADFQEEHNIDGESGVAGAEMYAQLYYSADAASSDDSEPVQESSDSSSSEEASEEESSSDEAAEEESSSDEAAEEEAAAQEAAEEEAAAQEAAEEEAAAQEAAEEEAAAQEAAEEEAAAQEAAEEEAAQEAAEEEAAQEAAEEEAAAQEAAEEDTQSTSDVDGETINVEATAYTAFCNGCSGVTATGIDLRSNPNQKVIAVDPDVIPLGSTVHVEGYGTAVAGDTGGAINGNKIDLFMPERSDAIDFGRRSLEVTIVDTP